MLEISSKKTKFKEDEKFDQALISNIETKIRQLSKELGDIRNQMNGFRTSLDAISVLHTTQDKNVDDYIASSQITRLMTKVEDSTSYRLKESNFDSLHNRKSKRIKSAKNRLKMDQSTKLESKNKLKCFEMNAPQIHIRTKYKSSISQGPTPVQSCTTLKSLVKIPSKIIKNNQSSELDLCLMPENMFADYI